MVTKPPVIAGIGESDRIGVVPGVSSLRFQAEAAVNCLRDSGLDPAEVDWLLTNTVRSGGYARQSTTLAEYLGIHIGMPATVQASGATGLAMVEMAAAAVSAGYARNALVVVGDAFRSGFGIGGAMEKLAAGRDQEYELPYGPLTPTMFALATDIYMRKSGATLADLAAVAVTMREHGSRTPRAQLREAVSLEDVMASPVISSPLRRLDCSIVSDGGAAVLILPYEQRSRVSKPVFIQAIITNSQHEHLTSYDDDPTEGLAVAASAAYARAAITPRDVDYLGIYDCFTGTVLAELEALGFCEPGEAGAMVSSGELRLAGSLPSNTHGGLLAYCHMGSGAGLFHLLEAVRQHRGQAGAGQLQRCELSVTDNVGGIFAVNSIAVLASGS